jgi:hypothetical protein
MTEPPVAPPTPDPARSAEPVAPPAQPFPFPPPAPPAGSHAWAVPGFTTGHTPVPGYAPPPGYVHPYSPGYAAPSYAPALAPEGPPLPRTFARFATGLAAVGLAISWIPILTWFGALLLIAGLVLAVVALASPRQGGTARAGVALAMSLLGLMVSLAMTIPSIFFLTGGFFGAAGAGPYEPSVTSAEDASEEDAPNTPPALPLVTAEVAFGRVDGPGATPGSWWYAALLDNPNEDWIYADTVEIAAVAADGTVIATDHLTQMLLHDRSAVAGSFDDLGDLVVNRIEVTVPETEGAVSAPRDETGSFRIEGVAVNDDGTTTTVSGTIHGDFADEYRRVPLVAVLRDDEGRMIGAARFELGLLPAEGAPRLFEIPVPGDFPHDVTVEVYASL